MYEEVALPSFPFLEMNHVKLDKVKESCKYRVKDDPLCPFVNLGGHTLSCALVLAILVDSVEHMENLSEAVEGICLQLEAIKTDPSEHSRLTGDCNLAKIPAEFLNERLKWIDCPDDHPMIVQVNKDIGPIANIRSSIKETNDLLTTIPGKSFSDKKVRGEINGLLKTLRKHKEVLFDWQVKLKQLRGKIAVHVLESRYNNLSSSRIPLDDLESELGLEVNNMVNASGLWPQVAL